MQMERMNGSGKRENVYMSTTTAPGEEVIRSSELVVGEEGQRCMLNCQCEKCKELGYTAALELQSTDRVLFAGPIMVKKPVSNFHHMLGPINLTYCNFHTFALEQITKLKASHADDKPGLKRMYLKSRDSQRREEILVNGGELGDWYFNFVRAKLYGSCKIGIPQYLFEGQVIGTLRVKGFFGWKNVGAEITDRLRFEKDKEIKVIKEFWTRFEIIDVDGLCLVVKFWDFLTKWEVGIPLRDLSRWLYAFMTLVKD